MTPERDASSVIRATYPLTLHRAEVWHDSGLTSRDISVGDKSPEWRRPSPLFVSHGLQDPIIEVLRRGRILNVASTADFQPGPFTTCSAFGSGTLAVPTSRLPGSRTIIDPFDRISLLFGIQPERNLETGSCTTADPTSAQAFKFGAVYQDL